MTAEGSTTSPQAGAETGPSPSSPGLKSSPTADKHAARVAWGKQWGSILSELAKQARKERT